MAEIFKTFNIPLDIARAKTSVRNILVEGDTGNKFVITLTDDGVAVDLSTARVLANFTNTNGTFNQSSFGASANITIGGASHNIITVPLNTTSVANGNNICEIQVYSGTTYTTLVTTAQITFTGRKAILNDETIASTTEYAVVTDLIAQVTALTEREQADWDETDNTKGTYIANKPVVGVDVQQNTDGLTAETTLSDTDMVPFYDASATAHRKSTWANIVAKIRTALFSSVTGIAKINGAGGVSAAEANVDYAAAEHASRHVYGAADGITPSAILLSSNVTVATTGWATFTADGTEETAVQTAGYIYRKSVSVTGMLADMFVRCTLGVDADVCGAVLWKNPQAYAGGFYIYAKSVPSSAFTILSVTAWKAVS